jgi:hypothetical protein
LLGNGSVNMPMSRQWLSSYHLVAATDMHTRTEELLEAVFSVPSRVRLHNVDQLPLLVCQERVCWQAVS